MKTNKLQLIFLATCFFVCALIANLHGLGQMVEQNL